MIYSFTTTPIPFLQAIKHFCNFLASYFMEGFAFLIDDTENFVKSFYIIMHSMQEVIFAPLRTF